MKILLLLIIATLTSEATYAFDASMTDPVDLPKCPASSEDLLEVNTFIPSADVKSDKGICQVKATFYSWWDLNDQSMDLHEVEVNAGDCNSNQFINVSGKHFIRATVTYQGQASRCGSKLGCFFECKPVVELWPF